MSRILIKKYNSSHLLVIDTVIDNIYQNFINTLKNNNIINTKYNKINFLINDVCIIFNINDNDNKYKPIKDFKEYYNDKLKKHNINLILLNREENIIYNIKTLKNNFIICHSKTIKKLFELEYFNLLTKFILINYSNNELYIKQLIKQLLINIVNQEKLNKKCFKNTYKFILNWDENDNDNDNVDYLNKTIIIKI